MLPMTISRRILGCLLLILLLQSGNALKSKHLDTILSALDRIENAIIRQDQKNALSCIVPFDKLHKMISELTKSDEETAEARRGSRMPRRPADLLNDVRKVLLTLDDDFDYLTRKKDSQRGKNKENMNTDVDVPIMNANMNTNMNTNTNINADQYRARRTLDNKLRNINFNSNSNFNRNRRDYSYEDDAK